MRSSFVLEIGGTFLDERLHAFFSVFESEGCMERTLLSREPLLKTHFKRTIYCFLANGHAHLGHRSDFLRQFDALRQKLQ